MESWVTCLTAFQLNYCGKEDSWYLIYSSTLHAKINPFSVVMLSHLYEYCKGQLWSQHAASQHPRTDALGVTVGLIFIVCSAAG